MQGFETHLVFSDIGFDHVTYHTRGVANLVGRVVVARSCKQGVVEGDCVLARVLVDHRAPKTNH